MHLSINKNKEKGQILLIVVLAAVISLTVGLSAASRTITNTKISTQEADSQKALSAAEAGVEQALAKVTPPPSSSGNLSNSSTFNTTSTPISGSPIALNGGSAVLQDDGIDVWLSNYPDGSSGIVANRTLTIYWMDNSSSCAKNAAIEIAVIVITGSKANPTMSRSAFDNTSCSRPTGNNHFSAATNGSFSVGGLTYQHRITTLPIISNGIVARIIPIYADAKIAVESNPALPAQGFIIQSSGSSGNASRKIRVYQGFPKLPIEFFPYNLFQP